MNKIVAFSLLCFMLLGLVSNSLADRCDGYCREVYEPCCGYDRETREYRTYGNHCKLGMAWCETNGRVVYAYQGPCNYITNH